MRHDRQVNGGSKAFLSDHDHEVLIFPKISSSIVSMACTFQQKIQFCAAGLVSASKATKTDLSFLLSVRLIHPFEEY